MKRLFLCLALMLAVTPSFAVPPLRYNLLSNATASEVGYFDWPGGVGDFVVIASAYNGATITLQVCGGDDSTWINVSSATALTANGNAVFSLPKSRIRALVSGGTPAGVYAYVGLVQD